MKRRTMLTGAAALGLAACSREGEPAPAEPAPKPSESASTGAPENTAEAPTPAVAAPPSSADFANGQAAGVGAVRYDMSAVRDWSDIDRWYREQGRARHEFTGEPRVHRIVAGDRGAGDGPSQNEILASGMMLENDPAAMPSVVVIAHHNVTRLSGGAVNLGGTVYDEPLMGIHAPEVAGDVFTWYVPGDGGTRKYAYEAYDVEIIPDADGEYAKLFEPLPDGTPLLVTYQCHPCGSLRERRVVRHRLVSSAVTDTVVEYVAG